MKHHVCESAEPRLARMELASLSHDADAYQHVRNEIGDCARCWEAVTHWAIQKLAGTNALQAGSLEAAADVVVGELGRLFRS